jgi:6,7-dimethyl-8-ribityllumazine synthase
VDDRDGGRLMAGHGVPAVTSAYATGRRVAVIAASWHREVMAGLLDGAVRGCNAHGVEPTVVRVPGSFELPVAAERLARTGRYDVLVALGVVVRGETPHFDYVCRAATDGLTRVALDHALPVGFGLLTCDTVAQALARAGLPESVEDKGYEAAAAALQTLIELDRVLGPPGAA